MSARIKPSRTKPFFLRLAMIAGLLAAAAVLAGACAPLALINHLVPGDTYRAERDIAYGPLARQRLDVYLPQAHAAQAGRSGAPLAVFFYGGGWTSGERADYLFAGEALASRGMVTVVADYRLYPEVRYPDFLADCAQVLAWARHNAVRLGADPQRIYLIGHSAGAYNAAMLAFAPEYLAAVGMRPADLRGFIGLAGPYDFLPLTRASSKQVFGYPDTPRSTQPIDHVQPGSGAYLPPALLLTAADDSTVSPANSARLAARLRAAGGVATEISYPGLDHQRVVGALAAPLRGLAPVLDDIVAFVAHTP